jgi:phytoene synthase
MNTPSAVMARRAKTFRLAAQFLPLRQRCAVETLYQFCRAVDDLADDPRLDDRIALANLDRIARWLADPVTDPATVHPTLPDIAGLITAYDLDPRSLQCLVEGARSDRLVKVRANWTELRRYCFQVAGSVGVALAHLFGAREPAAVTCAATLGVAMQLTNIIRDVGEDLDRGIIYLPQDELARFGYDRERLERRVVDDDFVALLRDQIARARQHYAAGLAGVFWLPVEARFPIALAGRLYAAILDRVEANHYEVFRRRAATSLAEKVGCAATTHLGLRLAGWSGDGAWEAGAAALQPIAEVVASELGGVDGRGLAVGQGWRA